MTLHPFFSRRLALVASLLTLAVVSMIPAPARAQQPPVPKVEVFAGYSFVYPNAQLTGVLPGGITPVGSCLCSIPRGAGASLDYNLLPWLGLTADFSGNWAPHETLAASKINKSSVYSLAAGPTFTLRHGRFAPFAELLFGGQRLAPELFPSSNSFGMLAGFGMDIGISKHIAFRPIRADFAYSNHTFGINPSVAPTDIRGMRLQSGLLFTFGGAPAAAPAAIAPALAAPVAMVAAPVAAPVFSPPTVACSAMPSNMNVGEVSTITAAGNSPQSLALTYSFSSNAGTLAANGNTAMLATAGAAAGVIDVTCNVVDAQGQSASAIAQVTLAALAVAPRPMALTLCSLSFARDMRRPVRVDNAAKACLDDIALTLNHQADADLVITGSAQTGEPHASQRAAQRAENAKAYLVTEKGIEPSRITLYTGTDDARATSDVLVPAGATDDTPGRTPVPAPSGGPR